MTRYANSSEKLSQKNNSNQLVLKPLFFLFCFFFLNSFRFFYISYIMQDRCEEPSIIVIPYIMFRTKMIRVILHLLLNDIDIVIVEVVSFIGNSIELRLF